MDVASKHIASLEFVTAITQIGYCSTHSCNGGGGDLLLSKFTDFCGQTHRFITRSQCWPVRFDAVLSYHSSDTQFHSPQDMFSYCKIAAFILGTRGLMLIVSSFELDGIAGSITIAVINYALLGFQFPVDDFYMHSFEIWLATTVVFFGSGNVGFTLLEYRLGEKELVRHS